MVYQNKFVGVVKVGGKVLREDNGIVGVPFGSEYSLLLKNLNSVKSMVKISIDGTDAIEGTWLVINPHSDLELERFIKNGNLNKGNRFKFIERTKEIEEHKGIGLEDGLIRIEYKFQRKEVEIPVYKYRYYDDRYKYRPHSTRSLGGISGQSVNGGIFYQQATCTTMDSIDVAEPCRGLFFNDQGITVAGSESEQSFYTVPSFETEQSDVLVIRLKGKPASNKPVVVQDKLTCSTCGKSNKSDYKFCFGCGTSLNII